VLHPVAFRRLGDSSTRDPERSLWLRTHECCCVCLNRTILNELQIIFCSGDHETTEMFEGIEGCIEAAALPTSTGAEEVYEKNHRHCHECSTKRSPRREHGTAFTSRVWLTFFRSAARGLNVPIRLIREAAKHEARQRRANERP